MSDQQPGPDPKECSISVLPDALLGRVLTLCGKEERQVTLVSRRWNRLYWSEPSLWGSFEGSCDEELAAAHPEEHCVRLLAVAQRVGHLAHSFHLDDLGAVQKALRHLQREPQLKHEFKELLGRWEWSSVLRRLQPQRARALRLSTVPRGAVGWGAFSLADLAGHAVPLYATESLPASTLQRVGALRGLTSLCLASWQLPACTPAVLARLKRLQALRLRAREASPACMEAVLSLTGLRSLFLATTQALPATERLTQLSGLTSLVLHQRNPVEAALAAPALEGLPRLERYILTNQRGPVLVNGCEVDTAMYTGAGACAASGPHLYLGFCHGNPPLHSLAALLDGLVPSGVSLEELEASLLHAEDAAALAGCTHLSSLRALSISGLHCQGDSGTAAVRALLARATALTRLALDRAPDLQTGHLLADYSGPLEMLQLSYCGLRDLPVGTYLPTLRHLDLSGNDLVHVPPELAAASRLRTLRLCGNEGIALSGNHVEVLLAPPRLLHLDLRGIRVWPAHLIKLARGAPHLHIRADSEEDQWDEVHPPMPSQEVEAAEADMLAE